MIKILTPDQMRSVDAYSIQSLGVPSAILMENAARSAADYIREIIRENELDVSRILFLCASGNNGGDGFAAARRLCEDFDIVTYWTGSRDKMSDETRVNFRAMKNLGIPTVHIESEEQIESLDFDADCIVDAALGVGGSENLRGLILPIMQKIKNIDVLKVAIDAPTGLNTETGAASEFAFDADYTITMFAVKTGMLYNRGAEVCGEILTAGLGVPSSSADDFCEIYALEQDDVYSILPERKSVSSKFDYGKVLIVAGSRQFPGAGALCANAAIKSGAGLVFLASSEISPAILPEVIPIRLPATDSGSIALAARDALERKIDECDVLAGGPGLSDDKETIELARRLIEYAPNEKTVVVDADAIRAIDPEKKYRKNVILTPHSGEISRLTGVERKEIEAAATNFARERAEKMNCTIHLKYAPATTTDGETTYLTLAGNPGMASGGAGDVLTGMIAALAARGIPTLEAVALAAYLHARAGDVYAENFNRETLTASELIRYLQFAF